MALTGLERRILDNLTVRPDDDVSVDKLRHRHPDDGITGSRTRFLRAVHRLARRTIAHEERDQLLEFINRKAPSHASR